MKTYKIPVSWEVAGIIKIQAKSLDQALDIFDENIDHYPLPEGEYINSSFQREDYDYIKEINGEE